ncbi:MOSC domain-containing protein YiiM [Paucibacter oligotrophus]|uniref:MOSC domain-containing protein YiiM n=1 Tax=Roseateles oligotrophus TaxID=1769250 RepID=A0A840LB50_9BURK|nr:MOSC domain-containing protein [Roseateles oligotrophus]MBB4843428.1 MOSC domain-containing protein YiiM [Roseateles oligotrophus]
MQLISLNTATAQPLEVAGGKTVLSGIRKQAQTERLAVQALGLAGDEQADLSVHGGISKAVYAYPVEHYAFWQTLRGQAKAAGWNEALPHGAMGENLTLAGLLESQVWIGDVLKFPDCELMVSEPRFPCFKFNAVMGFNQAVKMMGQSGWCGFYLSVQTPGTLQAGEAFELIAGPREMSIPELFRVKFRA